MIGIIKKYGPYIRAKVVAAVSNEAEREELMEEIIIHVYEKLSKMVYTEEGKFEYWLHTVVNNYIVSWLRAKSRRPFISDIKLEYIPSTASSAGKSLYREKVYRILWEVVNTLENEQRDMLLLHYQQGIHLTQIAKMQGIPYNTFYKKFKKALILVEHLCMERGITRDDYWELHSK